jgi:hypothetical protein
MLQRSTTRAARQWRWLFRDLAKKRLVSVLEVMSLNATVEPAD